MAAGAMDDLADRLADRGVTSVFIYTREAHPAERYRHHTSMELKAEHARSFQRLCAVRRKILLDDLSGTVHRAYGSLPNMSWILGRRGLILYKAAWTIVDDIEDALAVSLDRLERQSAERLRPEYSERLAWRVDDPAAFRAGLERCGPQALRDFYGPSHRPGVPR